MPKETIRRLSEDLRTVLVAGAHLAASHPPLKKDQEALAGLARQLGDKAPVLGQLSQALGKALGASGKDASRELVSVTTMVAQIRAAQAQPAPAPATQPLPSVLPVGTPCNARDLTDLYEALVSTGQGRMEVIERAIEGEYVADLRLVEALIHAMADGYIGDVVSQKAVPKLGRALVAPIRQRLNLKGKAVDGRRLRALVAVERTEASALLRQALEEGSGEVREAALDAIADHARGVPELEPLVLELIRKEKVHSVRRAAVRALAGYGSDASLEALVAALDVESTRSQAAEALGASTHPQAAPRVLARLAAAVSAAPPRKTKAAATTAAAAATKQAAQAARQATQKAKEERREIVEALLGSLAGLKDPAIAPVALDLLDEFGEAAARAVIANGDREQLRRIADLIQGDDEDLFESAVQAAKKLGGDETFQRLTAVLKAKDRESKKGQERFEAVLEQLDPASDPRFTDVLLELVTRGPRALLESVVEPLGATRDRRATKPLLALLASERKSNLVAPIIQALGTLADPAAVDPILERLSGSQDHRVRWAVRHAILEIGERSSVAKVRDIFVALKKPDDWTNWDIKGLLRALEQRFPGE